MIDRPRGRRERGREERGGEAQRETERDREVGRKIWLLMGSLLDTGAHRAQQMLGRPISPQKATTPRCFC